MLPEVRVIPLLVVSPVVDAAGFSPGKGREGDQPGALYHILQGPALHVTEICRQGEACPGGQLLQGTGEVLAVALNSDLVPQEALEAAEEISKIELTGSCTGRCG